MKLPKYDPQMWVVYKTKTGEAFGVILSGTTEYGTERWTYWIGRPADTYETSGELIVEDDILAYFNDNARQWQKAGTNREFRVRAV